MLVAFSPIFVADTNVICGYNFVAPLKLNETIIRAFFQFYCKINRNQLEIVVKATYGLQPINTSKYWI